MDGPARTARETTASWLEVNIITLNADHQANCVYTLTSLHNTTDGHNGLPSITRQITIEGKGATLERSSIAGTPYFRIFHVAPSGNQVLSLADSTVISNSAGHSGGGLFNRGELFLTTSIVTTSPSGGDCSSSGTLYSVTNLIGDGSCRPVFSGDARPEPLGASGGSTETSGLTTREPDQ